MPTKTLIAGVIFILFSFSHAIVLGQCTVYYCNGCVRNGLCPEYQTFSTRAEAEQSGRYACPGGGWYLGSCSGEGGNTNNVGKLITSPIPSGIIGGVLGALAGSFQTAPNGENQAGTGAAFGYGVFSTLSLLINKKKRPVGENIVIGSLIGGSLGYVVGKTEHAYSKATIPPKTDNTLIYAGAGAVVGAAVDALTGFHKKTKGGYSFQSRKKNFMSNIAFTMTGNKIVLFVRL